ncbi:MAG TPA: hypothetical protein DHW66_07235, partial [Alteromonas sp.]|nr:hypothetical protein [Alteromonas sp.]
RIFRHDGIENSHPRMLLGGDLLKRLFQRSQADWEIPDRYFVSSGMTVNLRMYFLFLSIY